MFIRKPFRYTFFNATLILLILNVAVYFLQNLGITFIVHHRNSDIALDVTHLLSANYFLMTQFHFWWQPVTYMFVHGSLTHILFNMLALFIFGITLEKTMGSKEFLLFYMFCGILDGIISILIYWYLGKPVTLMGASGAIYALLFMYAVVFPRNRLLIWGIIPIRAPILVLIYAVIAFVSQLFDITGGTAHLTHLFGFVLAWIYMVVRMGIHPLKVWRDSF